ncbi:uncharacterized protein [Asterias amurensis]|uniref:uncharacterized protein isoform X2 n=1 Tax=Asterias amurensis TaxID=7602 RepID=UPI003AB51C09
MNSVPPQCVGPPAALGAVSVLVATCSSGGVDGPLPESTFPQDGEAWTAKNARIIALRKEKSRDAARSRRGKENYEYYELAKMLPLPAAITSQLDKASIIRLTMSYLKIRDFAMQGDPPWHTYLESHGVGRSIASVLQGRYSHQHSGVSAIAQEVYEHNLGGHILQALDGFLFGLSNDGRFLYISETVSIYLGLSQVELTGSSFFDYVHVGDHAEVAEQLGMKLPPSRTISQTSVGTGSSDGCQSSPVSSPTSPTHSDSALSLNMSSPDSNYHRSFVIRMKSTLTKRGVHIKSSGYKVIHITGALRPRIVLTQYSRHSPVIMGFTAVAQSLPPPTINEIHLEPTMFVCKLDLDFTIIFCEAKIQEFIDLSAEDVTDRNFYSFLHAQDIANMRVCHNDLLNKGQMITRYYRWMCKSGGYIWIQSTATLAYARTSNDRSFMFINQVISHAEAMDTVMDISQMSSLPPDPIKSEASEGSGHESDTENTSTDDSKGKTSKMEKSPKYPKKTGHQEITASRGKSLTRFRKRKAHGDQRDSKKHKQSSQDITDKPSIVAADPSELKSVIVEGSGLKRQEGNKCPPHSNARKPKKVMEDQHLRQSLEDNAVVSPVTVASSDAGCQGCETIESEPSPGYISPLDQSVNSNGRDSDSYSNGSQGTGSRANEGWDNPPNREVPREPEVSRSYTEVGVSSRQVGTEDSIVIPKGSYCKGGSGCSPKPPDSLLTPPLSDTCQSQFVLPPVSSLSDTKPKHYTTDSIPTMLTSNNNNPLPVNKGFHQPAVSPEVELVSHHPGPTTILSKSHPANNTEIDCPASTKTEHLYNTHPRVITAVSTAYAGMPYANYGQYSNFQQYANPVNLAAHGYQSSPYSDPYKNFRSAHDMPMDLSYNNMGSYANMSLLHTNVTSGGAPHPYYHAAKMGYPTAPDSGLQVIHDRGCLDDATKCTNTKV